MVILRTGLAAVIAAAALASVAPARAEDAPPVRTGWTLVPVYSHSSVDGGRGNWRSAELDAQYTHSADLRTGFNLQQRRRFGRSDNLIGVSVSVNPRRDWEVHASATVSPNPHFSARRILAAGTEWRANAHWSFLLDARNLQFDMGTLNELRPGIIYWLDDDTWFTVQHSRGSGFGGTGYSNSVLRMDHRFANGHRLTVTHANGTEPEMDPALPNAFLTRARTQVLAWRIPLSGDHELLLGVEHENRRPYYTRNGAFVGMVLRF